MPLQTSSRCFCGGLPAPMRASVSPTDCTEPKNSGPSTRAILSCGHSVSCLRRRLVKRRLWWSGSGARLNTAGLAARLRNSTSDSSTPARMAKARSTSSTAPKVSTSTAVSWRLARRISRM